MSVIRCSPAMGQRWGGWKAARVRVDVARSVLRARGATQEGLVQRLAARRAVVVASFSGDGGAASSRSGDCERGLLVCRVRHTSMHTHKNEQRSPACIHETAPLSSYYLHALPSKSHWNIDIQRLCPGLLPSATCTYYSLQSNAVLTQVPSNAIRPNFSSDSEALLCCYFVRRQEWVRGMDKSHENMRPRKTCMLYIYT
jgi:hypothetical protein